MVELSLIAFKKSIFVTLICYMFNVIYLHNRLSAFRKVTIVLLVLLTSFMIHMLRTGVLTISALTGFRLTQFL